LFLNKEEIGNTSPFLILPCPLFSFARADYSHVVLSSLTIGTRADNGVAPSGTESLFPERLELTFVVQSHRLPWGAEPDRVLRYQLITAKESFQALSDELQRRIIILYHINEDLGMLNVSSIQERLFATSIACRDLLYPKGALEIETFKQRGNFVGISEPWHALECNGALPACIRHSLRTEPITHGHFTVRFYPASQRKRPRWEA
jgi:hypothetical protein